MLAQSDDGSMDVSLCFVNYFYIFFFIIILIIVFLLLFVIYDVTKDDICNGIPCHHLLPPTPTPSCNNQIN